MTKEQWDSVERELSSEFGRVNLKIDSYDVTLIVEPYKKLQKCIAVYVNGKIKTENIMNDCDIRRRFYCKHTKQLFKADKKKEAKMTRAERKALEELRKETVYEHYEPWWTSFKSMKQHFVKNNVSIELAEVKSS